MKVLRFFLFLPGILIVSRGIAGELAYSIERTQDGSAEILVLRRGSGSSAPIEFQMAIEGKTVKEIKNAHPEKADLGKYPLRFHLIKNELFQWVVDPELVEAGIAYFFARISAKEPIEDDYLQKRADAWAFGKLKKVSIQNALDSITEAVLENRDSRPRVMFKIFDNADGQLAKELLYGSVERKAILVFEE